MTTTATTYDVAIIGGGLAGLALSIQLASQGRSVVLIEKERYPFHKVCGEYISMESWDFLKTLGVPLDALGLPLIHTLVLTSSKGKSFTTKLPLGGFGISRYTLDALMAQIAIEKGVTLLQETKVEDVSSGESFQITLSSSKAGAGRIIQAKVCCGAYGKRSNLDVKWKRAFLHKGDRKLDNYIGVKYHIHIDGKEDVIGLHNFREGYCGISKVEGDRYCLCYLTKADALRKAGGQLTKLEEEVLYENPFLRTILLNSVRNEDFPITISQISFASKSQVENGVLLLGDAAGMITPLCGNGMSMALHSSKIAAPLINQFLKGAINRDQLYQTYQHHWERQFSLRLSIGRTIQRFFGKGSTTELFIGLFKTFPFLATPIVKLTHGRPF